VIHDEVIADHHLEVLGLTGPLERGKRELGLGDSILGGDDHQQRCRREVSCSQRRLERCRCAVEQERDLVLPRRRIFGESTEPLPRLGLRQHRRARRIGGDDGHGTDQLLTGAGRVSERGREDRGEVRTVGVFEPGIADVGRLRHHRADAIVGGAEHQDLAAAEARPPDREPRAVDLGSCAEPVERAPVIADLGPRVDALARLAVARAEVAVVVYQHRETGRREHLGEAIEGHLLDRREPVREHHPGNGLIRRGRRKVVPAAQRDIAGSRELHVAPGERRPGAHRVGSRGSSPAAR